MLQISKAVIQKNGKFLLLKRASYSKSYPSLWDFAGGKHELGETPVQAVERETKEETSYSIKPGDEIGTEEYHDKQHDILFHYFSPKILSGKLTLSSDHSKFKWFSREELKEIKLHPSVKLYLHI